MKLTDSQEKALIAIHDRLKMVQQRNQLVMDGQEYKLYGVCSASEIVEAGNYESLGCLRGHRHLLGAAPASSGESAKLGRAIKRLEHFGLAETTSDIPRSVNLTEPGREYVRALMEAAES